MSRDYSQFFSGSSQSDKPREKSALEKLGWQSFFAQQTDLEEMATHPPARVIEVHRNGLQVRGDGLEALIPPGPDATVGDWLLYDAEHPAHSRVLDRKSLFKRRAPGSDWQLQLIAANVDTSFLVTSCNDDFNVARLERYIVLSFEAGSTPVIVLTKIDLCEDPETYRTEALTISDRVQVVLLNARGQAVSDTLAPWCTPGQTVAFLGSSGVGKSTLVNAIFGEGTAETAAIRQDDSKGRHTTTRRQLHLTPEGCAVLDTPGMRELQMADAEAGIADLFSDLSDLETQCKFRDCQHETEPGCAIQAALEDGQIDPARLARWRKLAAEERFNSASLAERRASDKNFGKMVRSVQSESRHRKGRK